MTAADKRKTVTARLRPLCPNSLLRPIADAAIFQRFDARRRRWVDVDPPLQLVRTVLVSERQWRFPHVSGVITTPTLRADGSLLAMPGYDPQSELYLLPSLQMAPIPEHPTKEQARAALDMLTDLLSEFPFSKPVDRSVALSGLLTAHVRGSLPTAPVILVRADTPGTGKSLPHRRHYRDQYWPILSGHHGHEERRRDREAPSAPCCSAERQSFRSTTSPTTSPASSCVR